MRVKVTSGQENGSVVVEDKVTGEVCNYKSLSDMVASVLPGLYAKGLLVVDGGQL